MTLQLCWLSLSIRNYYISGFKVPVAVQMALDSKQLNQDFDDM